MTKMYGATSHVMTEVGGTASRTMKVCGATKSTLSNSIRSYIIPVVTETIWYISRKKLLNKMKEVCGATSHLMDKLIVSEQSERACIYN